MCVCVCVCVCLCVYVCMYVCVTVTYTIIEIYYRRTDQPSNKTDCYKLISFK